MTASPEIQEIAIITGAFAGIGAATHANWPGGVSGATGTPTQSGGRYTVSCKTLARFQAETTARKLSGNSIPRRCKKACKLGAWQPA